MRLVADADTPYLTTEISQNLNRIPDQVFMLLTHLDLKCVTTRAEAA